MISLATVRFVVVGGVVFLVDTALLWLLVRQAGLSPALATTVAYIAGVLLHFALSCAYTFADSAASWTRRLAGYAGMLLLNYLITLAVVMGMLTYVANNLVVAKAVAVATTAVTGYLGLRRLAFPRDKEIKLGSGR